MIFVDSNIPMYLVGAAHPHKDDARRLLERAKGSRIMSFDAGFDALPGLVRLGA